MRYHTIFLDWDGTLSQARFWGHWSEPGSSYSEHYRAIQQQLFIDSPDRLQAWMRGAWTAEACAAWLAPTLGLTPDQVLDGLAGSARAMTWTDPTIPALLAELRRRGYRLVIATDNMDTFPRWTVPALGLPRLVDGILDSHTLRSLKRDPGPAGGSAFFGPYLQRHGLAPADCLLIDDSADTTQAAAAWGLHVINIDRGQVLPALQRLLSLAEAS